MITGIVAALEEPDHYALTVALSDRQSGLVVAQSAARFIEAGLDRKPTRFFVESPVLVQDRSSEGYTKTSETPAGRAADALYISQVETSALLADALAAYNAEKWQQALAGYTAASKRTDGQQLRTFNGLYLTNVRLGNTTGAEQAFGKIVQLGLETNNLAVKLLFRPGSATEFWPGRDYSGVYPIWIRQLARAMQASGHCLNVVGHTSRTGSEAVNDRLSLQRSETVKRLLEGHTLSAACASGVGIAEHHQHRHGRRTRCHRSPRGVQVVESAMAWHQLLADAVSCGLSDPSGSRARPSSGDTPQWRAKYHRRAWPTAFVAQRWHEPWDRTPVDGAAPSCRGSLA